MDKNRCRLAGIEDGSRPKEPGFDSSKIEKRKTHLLRDRKCTAKMYLNAIEMCTPCSNIKSESRQTTHD